jgi:predicted DNA-binding ribbon-helix-helix protein
VSQIDYKGGVFMKSAVIKRSIVVAGHKTSVSLEDEFWSGLKEIAARRVATLSELVGAIDKERQHTNLSSALRLFVLDFYRSQVSNMEANEANDASAGFLEAVPQTTNSRHQDSTHRTPLGGVSTS